MKQILFSALVAIGVHALLLGADFNLTWYSVEFPEIPDRLTVFMMPTSSRERSVEPEPLPAIKQLPTLLPPPAPQLVVEADPAEIHADLPQKLPDAAAVQNALQPKPKKSLKARTFKPRLQPLDPGQQLAAQSQLRAAANAPVATPQSTASGPGAAVEKPRAKLTSVAAVHKPRTFFPDRPAMPLLERNPPPLYPDSARRRGYQGAVVLKVLVGVTGKVEEVEIDQSCGYDVLDHTALSAVRAWQFQPAVKDGEKVKMWVKVPVRFELKEY